MNKILAEWISKAEGDYAVLYRYHGASADQTDADKAFGDTEKIRMIMRLKLELHD